MHGRACEFIAVGMGPCSVKNDLPKGQEWKSAVGSLIYAETRTWSLRFRCSSRALPDPLPFWSSLILPRWWTKGLLTPVPDGHYEVRSFAVDEDRNNVAAYSVFRGTHTGEGGPVPPTGKRVETDYVYIMEFEGDRIRHMTKVWNDGVSLKQLGWMQ